jgi:type I restriction enzyme S subunit
MSERLSFFAAIHYGKSPLEIFHEEGTVPIYGTGGIYGTASVELFSGPAVIIPRKGSLSNPHYVAGPFWASDTTYAAVPRPHVDAKWLYYQLSQFNLESLNEATGVPSISRDWLEKIEIFRHSPDEQNVVAKLLSCIDNQIEAAEALIAKQERVRAGLMQDLFTRGIDENGTLRPPREEAPYLYHQTELGWLPSGWRVAKFGSEIDVIDPNPSHRYPDEIVEGVPICSTENFAGIDDFDLSFSKHVPEYTYSFQDSRCRFNSLDVVFARKGRIGLARRYGAQRKVFSHTVVMMKPLDQTVIPNWVLWLARCDAFLSGIAREMNSNSGVPTLGIDFIKSIFVPFPGEAEQCTMADVLDQSSAGIAALTDDLNKLQKLKSGLMQDLLVGKVPVEALIRSEAA